MPIKEYKAKRQRIVFELELIDTYLKNVLNDRSLKNSSDVIVLQIKRLAFLDQLRFLRPSNKKDIAYRNRIFNSFPEWAKENISDEMHLVFHGTTLANTERILNSGRIISGKDRWTIHTSGDDTGEISISTKDFLEISMKYHMDLIETYRDYELFVPAGALFVWQLNQKEYQSAKDQLRVHNVSLKRNSQQLYAVVTTPENINRVKWWVQKNGFSSDKVYDFQGFQKKIKEDSLFYSLINYHYQNQKI